MVALEAWALGRPVLANGRCDVLVGQCQRSNAGLYLSERPRVRGAARDAARRARRSPRKWARMVGASTQRHYAWEVVEGKYLAMFDRLQTQARDPRPAEPGTRLGGAAPAAAAARGRAGERGADWTGSGDDRPFGSPIVKLAFITPRYGADIVTGPEHACRLMAEHISRRHDVDVHHDVRPAGRLVEERAPRRPGPRAWRPDPAVSGVAAARAGVPSLTARLVGESHGRADELRLGQGVGARGAPACSTTCDSSSTPTTPWSSSR